MSFIRFVFSFLYTRNWHTGQKELSTPRVWVFSAGIILFIIGTIMIAFLQTPVVYSVP